jgi:phosphatidylinositol-3,4,5-trisphosphate 3-phosphatase and dual-specificity protein phosphatase PTEN
MWLSCTVKVSNFHLIFEKLETNKTTLAGKGRSGTVACAYVLSLGDHLESTQSERNCNEKQWALIQADLTIKAVTGSDNVEGCPEDIKSEVTDPLMVDGADGSRPPDRKESTLILVGTHADAVQRVLDLHTARRMKLPSASYGVKPGLSVYSQRRWLHYWSLHLHNVAQTHSVSPSRHEVNGKPTVRLTQIKLRTEKVLGVKATLTKLAGHSRKRIPHSTDGNKPGLWVSLARYDDDFVGLLEECEKRIRNDSVNGQHTEGTNFISDAVVRTAIRTLFNGGKWDNVKMVQTFARIGLVDQGLVNEVREIQLVE